MTISNQNLKLIAIQPLSDCNSKYTRSLKRGGLFPLIQNYKFEIDTSNQLISIEANRETEALYNQKEDATNDIMINISAVVGQNGSGKSSLVELLYLAIYVVAINQELLILDEDHFWLRRVKKEYEEIKEGLKLNLFYELDQKFFCLRFDSELKINTSPRNIEVFNIFQKDQLPIANLFYTIAINYSIYGLNEKSSGYWLNSLFHKNDGYKTPIVINPFRDRGNINILSEAHLAQSRLLANMKPSTNETMSISANRAIKSVEFERNIGRINMLDRTAMPKVISQLEKDLKLNEEEIFNAIYLTILNTKDLPEEPDKIRFRRMLQRYVIKKIVKICKNYKEYRDSFYREGKTKIPSIKYFDKYLEALSKDSSHITLKLHQALNTYRFNMLRRDGELGKQSLEEGAKLRFSVQELSRRIETAFASFPERSLVEFIPAAMLTPTIIMEDESNFTSLSSGEQQFIHSMQSVIYHLNNLNSAFAPNDGRETYGHVNVVLDEIELYFHPEFQRRYIDELIGNIRRLSIPKISSINIVFLTHSPFILSDIPKANILKLKAGEAVRQADNTFAGNIHTMLSDSFFMESTMGEFAKGQLSSIITFYERVRVINEFDIGKLRESYLLQRELFYYVINNIGEDVLAGVLKNHLDFMDKRFGVVSKTANEEKQRLLQARKQIDEQLRKLNYDQN